MRPSRFFSLVIISAFLFISLASCSDDSTSSNKPFIEITDASSSFTQLNDGCNFSQGPPGTRFDFELVFEASSDIDIDGVEFDILFSSGVEAQNRFEDDFDITDNSLIFDWCFRYGSSDWFELVLKILAEDEELESNEVTIRVDKPEGANKLQ